MESDKPLISIVMAVYHPRMDWLIEQLDSLNAQTYENLELIICDDGPDAPVDEAVFAEHIKAFPWQLVRNDKNMGSNKTFERLTGMANGEYIAYCDQDDVWMPEKIEWLFQKIQGCTLAYSDMVVIDCQGCVVARTLKRIRPRLQYVSGDSLENYYLFTNCTAGCSMMIRREIAQLAIPFPMSTVCDQWICAVAAHYGRIAFLSESLVKYRQHLKNQTGILTGIVTKSDYWSCRILPMIERIQLFDKRIGLSKDVLRFAQARKDQEVATIWKYRRICPKDAIFEIAIKWIPDWIFDRSIKLVRGKPV